MKSSPGHAHGRRLRPGIGTGGVMLLPGCTWFLDLVRLFCGMKNRQLIG